MCSANFVFIPHWHISGIKIQGCLDQSIVLGYKKERSKSTEGGSERTVIIQIILKREEDEIGRPEENRTSTFCIF